MMQSAVATGHSGRIRYANPQDLPSYPSTGLKEGGAAAGAAASLGWANQKPIEPWRPSSSSSASVAAHLANDHQRRFEPWKPSASSSAASAALLANDYKMPPIRETERSSAPYQAATLAAASAASALSSPRQDPVSAPRSTWGSSAANQAFHAATTSTSHSSPTEETYALTRNQSLRGAHGAVANSRPRSISTPQKYSYPDQANASTNALNAAGVSYRASVRSKYDEAGSVPYTNMAREMFTSHPPVKLEVDEQKHADSLHASAVAMAKRMYTQQQKAIDSARKNDASTAAQRSSSFSRHGAASPVSTNDQDSGFPNLQEAAYRLAQERLAKLHEEHQQNNGAYQDYYGATGTQRNTGRLGSIRGKLTRRRSSSDGDLVDDRKRSQQIRQEMSMFNSTLTKVDEEKRTRARQQLLAAAQRNVKAQMEGMDRKLYDDTGRAPPSRLNDWEMKAHSAALLRVESGRDPNEGKVDLGAGVFMTQEEVNAIAAKRIQPVLDDINRKAEAERERQLTAKLDEEHRKEAAEREKGREKEIQDIHKKLKDQQKYEEKRIKAEAKAAEKVRKEQEKAAKTEEKRKAREEKHRSNDAAKPVAPDLRERASEEDHHDDNEPEPSAGAATITSIPPLAVAPVLAATPVAPVAPVAVEATPAEVEESKAKTEDVKPATAQPEERRRSKFLKKPLALDLRKRSAKDDGAPQPPNTAPLERRAVDSPTTAGKSGSAVAKERSHSFSGGRRESSSPPLEDEPRPGGNKIRSWFSSHFSSRPRTKSGASSSAPGSGSAEDKGSAPTADTEGGFIGGAALRRRTNSGGRSTDGDANSSSTSASLRDVALASVSPGSIPPIPTTTNTYTTAAATRKRSPARSVSSISSYSQATPRDVEREDDDTFDDAREIQELARTITPPPAPRDPSGVQGMARLSASPGRGSRFSEVLD